MVLVFLNWKSKKLLNFLTIYKILGRRKQKKNACKFLKIFLFLKKKRTKILFSLFDFLALDFEIDKYLDFVYKKHNHFWKHQYSYTILYPKTNLSYNFNQDNPLNIYIFLLNLKKFKIRFVLYIYLSVMVEVNGAMVHD